MSGGKDTYPSAESREQLWQALIDGDETRAVTVVRRALDTGAAERVLLELIAPAQERVGLAWAANDITVAQEHAATSISERCVAAVADATAPSLEDAVAGRVLVACVDGEWHALPARLVSEVLRLRGWRVDYLGAQVPTEHLIAHVHRTGAQAVLLSSSIPTLLPGAHQAIGACRSVGVPVLAGGAAFGPQGRYARLLRAEWAKDASAAAALLGRNPTRTRAQAVRLPEQDLPHLNDQEYTMVCKTKPQLVKQTLVDVEEGFPAMRHYSAFQLDRTVEDIDFVVSYLATALYVDDAGLFHRFITWTADILAARGVPPWCLLPALESLLTQLKDFPRATGILGAARHLLTPPGPAQLA
ncbi:cobalamin-binding protein [Streptomyces sp. SID8379]|uniref:cobalamin B12-binding domain-containing protein n=1 Tax=unclassified Streptomyces TaxID=2593676 RepID=UPI00035F960F|nr:MULTISPECIES: B12-binding domain-containing protein [unclassified Streptomyces]MYW69760.1 cobalamin-binding protein [Streptomyces sp. SID8379]